VAQEEEEERRGYRSRLIKTTDRISERPPRGGLSISAQPKQQSEHKSSGFFIFGNFLDLGVKSRAEEKKSSSHQQ
jgi:hypothetical protein